MLGTRPFECTYHIFGTQIGRSRLSKAERKGLKKDLKIIHHLVHLLDQSTKVIQVNVNNGSWRDHFSLERDRAAQEWDGQAKCLKGRHGSGNLGIIKHA